MEHWGLHYSLDISDCNIDLISDPDNIFIWITELVELIDMIPYGDPQIVRFGKDNKAGYTCSQLIETSNICAHFSESDRTAFIDVFSCKEFSHNMVRDFTLEMFEGTVMNDLLNYRG
jgi:S-adenosylmethionine decarboxylase